MLCGVFGYQSSESFPGLTLLITRSKSDTGKRISALFAIGNDMVKKNKLSAVANVYLQYIRKHKAAMYNKNFSEWAVLNSSVSGIKKGKALKNQRLAGKIKIPIFLNALVS